MLLFYSQHDMKAGKANSTIYFFSIYGDADKVAYHMVVIFGIEINSAEVFAEVAGIYIPNRGFQYCQRVSFIRMFILMIYLISTLS